jgi:nitrite reductase/ring-hydroxylating ferredoxin subunit
MGVWLQNPPDSKWISPSDAKEQLAFQHLERLGLPLYPRGWYYLCASDIKKGQVRRLQCAGHPIVVFRSLEGQLSALSAQCAHMSTDLGSGEVCKGGLRCPAHNWVFDGSGKCVEAPGDANCASRAKLRSYCIEERHGAVFLFLGQSPTFTLPFFEGAKEEKMKMGKPIRFELDVPWYAAILNGWDLRHFEFVHGRVPVSKPVLDYPTAQSIRICITSRITGKSVGDHILRLSNGSLVTLTMTCFVGNFMLAEAVFGRSKSFMLFSVEPQTPSTCVVTIFALAPKSTCKIWGKMNDWLRLKIRSRLTKSFFHREATEFKGIRFREDFLTEKDWAAKAFMSWLREKPVRSRYEALNEALNEDPFLGNPKNSKDSTDLLQNSARGPESKVFPGLEYF